MTFAGLVLKNLFRQRARTALAALGIAIGITTVVALGVITAGMKGAMGGFLTAGGADFVVAQRGASDLAFSLVREEELAALRARPDVARADGFVLEVAKLGSNPYFLVFGLEPEAFSAQQLALEQGRLPRAPDELALGSEAARTLSAGVGAALELKGRSFRVVGVYSVADTFRNAGAIAPLAAVQELAGRPGTVTAAYVEAAPGRDPAEVAAAIEREVETLATIEGVDELQKVDQGMRLMDAANLAISLLAVVIGGIGVMNTMVMSVFERTRELGVLRAVGWRGSRILRLVVLESLALCLLGAVAGVALGVGAAQLVSLVPAVSTFLVPAYPLEVFVRALAVGVAVALAGAAYPALRAVRLSPMEALRHE